MAFNIEHSSLYYSLILLQVYRAVNYYYMVESRTVWPNLWRVVNLIHILLILAHWFGCFYFLLSEAEGFQVSNYFHLSRYTVLTKLSNFKYICSLSNYKDSFCHWVIFITYEGKDSLNILNIWINCCTEMHKTTLTQWQWNYINFIKLVCLLGSVVFVDIYIYLSSKWRLKGPDTIEDTPPLGDITVLVSILFILLCQKAYRWLNTAQDLLRTRQYPSPEIKRIL